LKGVAIGLVGDGFFVFAEHEPLQTVVRKVSYRLFSQPREHRYWLLPVDPSVHDALLVVVPRCLLKIMPRFTGVITGIPIELANSEPGAAPEFARQAFARSASFCFVFPFRCSLAYDGAHELLPLQNRADVYSFDDFLRDQETIWEWRD